MPKYALFFAFFFGFLAPLAAQSVDYETLYTLRGHTRAVQNLRFSPDGKYLATASHDNTCKIWEVQSGRLVQTLMGHKAPLNEVSFSPDGTKIATASQDGTARVYTFPEGRFVGSYRGKTHVTSFKELKSISFVAFSKDGKRIFFGGDSGFLMEANVSRSGNNAKLVFSTHRDGRHVSSITGGAVTPSGKHLLITMGNYLLRIHTDTYALTDFIEYGTDKTPLNDVIVGPEPTQMTAWAYDGNVLIWEIESQKLVRKVKVTYPNEYSNASFDATKKYLVTGANMNLLNVWDWRRSEKVATLRGHMRIVRSVRYHPTQNLIASASYDGTARIWKPKDEDVPAALNPAPEVVAETPATPETPETPVVVRDTVREQVVLRDTVRQRVVVRDTVRREVVTTPPPAERSTTSTGEGSSLKESELEVGKTVNLKNIRFVRGSDEFLETAYPELEHLVAMMQKYDNMRIELAGHTDNVGKKALNFKLSKERVEAVQAYLLKNKISGRRITLKAYGDTRPIADNSNPETRPLNRRVEVTILAM